MATITRDEVLQRFRTSRQRKHDFLRRLEVEMKEEYKKRTGMEATYFEVW